MMTIRDRVATRGFAPGDRLPSIRSLATTLAVSPSTVVDAYDRLAAEGVVRARRGAGFYIATSRTTTSPSEGLPKRHDMMDPYRVARQSLDASRTTLKPGCGWLPPEMMPNATLRRGLRAVSHADDDVLSEYGPAHGSDTMRKLLQNRLAEEGLTIDLDQITLTTTGTQAIDLICRLLLRPGQTVLVDDPCYFNFCALLRVHQVRIVTVPYRVTGPDIAQFDHVLATEKPCLYITNSALHNPTGGTITPQIAHRVLNAATSHDMIIIEDDIFADFEPDPSPRLATLDGLNRVIRIGSFSKTLSASVRCGYIAARPDLIAALVDLQLATNFGGPSPVATGLITHMLKTGGYRKHMEDLRLHLVRARRDIATRLTDLGCHIDHMPRGGFYLWCRLPNALDAVALARKSLAEDIILAPGNIFSVHETARDFLRFNVAQSGAPRLWSTLERLIRATDQR